MTCQHTARSTVLFLLAAGALLAADLPYVGTWKLNPAKSNLAGSTVTYTQNRDEFSYSEQGQSYKFKADGRDYITPFGYTAAWKRIDAQTVQMVAKLGGKTIQTDTLTLSKDTRTLTVISKGSRPNGETWEDETDYARVSGGPGLAGTWKATKVKLGSLKQIEFAPFGADGLTWKIADFKVTCNASFDGKDYPATGPSAPPGLTVAIRKVDPRSFQLTEKKDKLTVYTATFTVSADGKTLTEVGSGAAADEKTTLVYDRQ
jgi:hypothetical protein